MDIPLLFGTCINIFLFYFNLFYLFPQYKSKKLDVTRYSIWIFALVTLLSVFENSFDYLYAFYNTSGTKVILQPGEVILTSIINLFFILLSVLYSIIRDWLKIEIVKRKLAEENLKLELNYLKSQISPHFLFNSLNNLYSIAIKNDDKETASGLSRLSTLMRFMLDKSDKTIVKLDEETEYLKSYVEMQRLRFLESDDIDISFNIKGETSHFNVPPFLLINFVENAFKHGIDYKKPSEIGINISVNKNRLLFKIENTNHDNKKTDTDSKVGLKNVRKRLDLIYGNDYDLNIISDTQKYVVELTLKSL
ncbi:MAG TPA: histidine kinase [Bacteroidales bacterium]|nr:histidine kinase [Bacteroidales bacterium]